MAIFISLVSFLAYVFSEKSLSPREKTSFEAVITHTHTKKLTFSQCVEHFVPLTAQFTFLKSPKHVHVTCFTSTDVLTKHFTTLKETLYISCDQLVFNPQSVQSFTEQNANLLLAIPNMKFVAAAFYVVFVLAIGVDAASVSLSSSQLTLNGNAHIQFYGPREEIWAGLSNGKIYDLIPSVNIRKSL